MRICRGKISRLSRELQTEVNRRLAAGESSRTLLPWLNAQPEVQTVLATEFSGRPVSQQNLSQWRLRRFIEWQLQLEADDYCQDLAEHADELDPILNGRLADSLAAFLAARYAVLLRHWSGEVTPEFEQKLRVLRGIRRDVGEMRRMPPPPPRVPAPTPDAGLPSASHPPKSPESKLIKVNQSQEIVPPGGAGNLPA